jgi:hypothetical protein
VPGHDEIRRWYRQITYDKQDVIVLPDVQ